MNLVPWLLALLPWATSPFEALFRITVAVAIVSFEMQLVTVVGVGSLSTLVPLNTVGALIAAGWQMSRRSPRAAWMRETVRVAPVPAVLGLVALVVVLNGTLPLTPADDYNLRRVEQIQRHGTLAYDLQTDAKENILGAAYELVLADLRAIPAIGPTLLRFHGVLGVGFYLIALASIRMWTATPATSWAWVAMLVVPVVFHQFVLLKNDLFIAVPALAGLMWLITHARGEASWRALAVAAWLVGLSVGSKPTNAALALTFGAGAVLVCGRSGVQALVAAAGAGLAGGIAAGVMLTFLQNAWYYGDVLARAQVADMGSVKSGLGGSLLSLGRFLVSLIDLGQLTPALWPGRGGWGSTFGLPFIWALATLIVHRDAPRARWGLAVLGFNFFAFGVTFPDADVAHRLALTPGLIGIAVAVSLIDRPSRWQRPLTHALLIVTVLSGVQIANSARSYLTQEGQRTSVKPRASMPADTLTHDLHGDSAQRRLSHRSRPAE